jgi:hypothetical protein
MTPVDEPSRSVDVASPNGAVLVDVPVDSRGHTYRAAWNSTDPSTIRCPAPRWRPGNVHIRPSLSTELGLLSTWIGVKTGSADRHIQQPPSET